MSLIVYNGSPRGEKSNSSVITSWFLEGYGSDDTEIRFLKKFKEHHSYSQEIVNYDQVLMVFPLYVDGMPGQVKHFYEVLSSLKDKIKDKQITFIIHSGFSDGIQSRVLEQHCIRFSKILNLNNHGVIIIPGSEGFRLMPPVMTKKKRIAVSKLGASFKANEQYSDEYIEFLYGKEKSSKSSSFILKIMSKLGLTNSYWNSQLKKNNAKDNCYDTPYENNPSPITTKAYISNK